MTSQDGLIPISLWSRQPEVNRRPVNAPFGRSRTTEHRATEEDRGCGSLPVPPRLKKGYPSLFFTLQPQSTIPYPGHVRPPCYRRDGKISSALLSRARLYPRSSQPSDALNMTLAPRQTRQPTSSRRITMYRIHIKSFTGNWLCSAKNPSAVPTPPPMPKSAQSRPIP